MNTVFFDIVVDKEKIQKELIFYSLFLLVFENFVSFWKETTRTFFSNGFAIDDETGKQIDFVKQKIVDGKFLNVRDKDKETEYNNLVFHRTKDGIKLKQKLSLFDWLVELQFINEEDYTILEKCYHQRNEYAHSIAECLHRYVSKEEKELLKSLIKISEKAARNWISEVEIPTSPPETLADLMDEDGNYCPPDEIFSGTQIFHTLVLHNLKDIL